MMLRSLVAGIFWLFGFYFTFGQNTEDYSFALNSPSDFQKMAGAPLVRSFSGVSSVKMVYNLRDNRLYFIPSHKYSLHYEFCKNVFEPGLDLTDFNQNNYDENPRRKYLLATLNYFRDQHFYTMECSPADKISRENVEKLFEALKVHFFEPSRLFLQLTNARFIHINDWKIPVKTPEELFSGQKLQIIQEGSVSGRLLFTYNDSLTGLGDVSDCIVVLNGSSNDIPVCRGIIVNELQTPLSHIAILSQNRKIPMVACTGAWNNPDINLLKGKFIRLKVEKDTFILEPEDDQKIVKGLSVRMIKLKFDTTSSKILSLKQINLKQKAIFGVKAVNLAEIQRVKYKGKALMVPEDACAIPMYYYFQHLKHHKIVLPLNRLLNGYKTWTRIQIEDTLAHIRELITESALDTAFLSQVNIMLTQDSAWKKFRFRSSSNAEDLATFNGAGLYTSETGVIGSKTKSIEKAVKKVWASLWEIRAFDERNAVGIDHRTAGMAILVHRSFPEEYVNGVAITRNLYRDFDFGFVLNMQKGDHSLVKPEQYATTEQCISYYNSNDPFFNNKEAIEYISFSSLNQNQPLLTSQEVFDLTQKLDCIKKRFYRKLGAWKKMEYKNFAMDVEFKFEEKSGERVLYFKQARPF